MSDTSKFGRTKLVLLVICAKWKSSGEVKKQSSSLRNHGVSFISACWTFMLRSLKRLQVAFCEVEPLFMCCSVGLFHLFPLKQCRIFVWAFRESALEQPWKWGYLTFLLSPLLPVGCTRKKSFGSPYVHHKKASSNELAWMGGLTNLKFVSEMLGTLVESCQQLI